jgi:hypothetical protein
LQGDQKREAGKLGSWKVKKIKENYKLQITMFKITNPEASMQSCNIIPTHLFFPSSYLLSFPLYPWPPGEKEGVRQIFIF